MKDRRKINKLVKAIFADAVKTKSIKQTGDSFKTMAGLLEKNPEILVFFKDIFQSEERHGSVLKTIAGKADFSGVALMYIERLQAEHHMDWLPLIHESFQRKADLYLGQERATVMTPFKLSPSDRDALQEALNALTGRKVFLREYLDPTLIAGVKVRIGSMVFDGSLSNQLQRIEKEISNAR